MNYGDIVGLEQGRRYAEARLTRDIERRRIARERAEERRSRNVGKDTTKMAGAAEGRAAAGATETGATAPSAATDARTTGVGTAENPRAEEARVLIHS